MAGVRRISDASAMHPFPFSSVCLIHCTLIRGVGANHPSSPVPNAISYNMSNYPRPTLNGEYSKMYPLFQVPEVENLTFLRHEIIFGKYVR